MSVVTLAKVKTHLNLTATTHDGELQELVDSAEAAIAERVGPLALSSTTCRIPGGSELALPVLPAATLTSVTPVDGTALTLSDLYLDQAAALVTFNSGAYFCSTYYDVVYQAGRTTCPDDLMLAVKELVRHLWSTQRGSAPRPGGGPLSDSTSNTLPGAAYVFPFRVEQLLAPHEQPGFA